MYTVTFKGTTKEVSGVVFWCLAMPMLIGFAAYMLWFGWTIYLSTSMLEVFTGIPALVCGLVVLATCASISINGVRKALLPEVVQQAIIWILFITTVCYQYFVQQWGVGEMLLLALPATLLVVMNFFKKEDK